MLDSDSEEQNADIAASHQKDRHKTQGFVHSLVYGSIAFCCFGIRMEDSSHQWKQTPGEYKMNVSFPLMLLVSEVLTHLKTDKAMAVLNLEVRGKFSSSYEFPSSFQL